MGPRAIIVLDVLPQHRPQMPLVDDDQEVQTLSPQSTGVRTELAQLDEISVDRLRSLARRDGQLARISFAL
jgi:hypothetical protein